MIKVLMLVSNLRAANGVASFAINYYKNLDHSKVQMDFALYSDRESTYYSLIEDCGGKIFILPSIKNMPEHIKACNEILEHGAYDVIHDNTLHISIPMMWCAKRKGVPVRILHSHSSKLGDTAAKEIRNRALLPMLRSFATDYTACSNIAGKTMFDNRPFTVIPNVVHTEKFKFEPSNREIIRGKMDSTSKFVVGSVGRMSLEKNPYFAMDVFKRLLKDIPNAEYWWAGGGPLDSAIKDYVKEQGIADKVRLLGSRDDVDLLYQGMDVFFLPSKFEGLGLVCIEAQAAGLPCIVSDSVPTEVDVTHNVTFIPLKSDVADWEKAFNHVYQNLGNRDLGYHQVRNSAFSDQNAGELLYKKYCCIMKNSCS